MGADKDNGNEQAAGLSAKQKLQRALIVVTVLVIVVVCAWLWHMGS